MPFQGPKECKEGIQNLYTWLTTTFILSFLMEGKDFIMYYDAPCSSLGVNMILDKKVIA